VVFTFAYDPKRTSISRNRPLNQVEKRYEALRLALMMDGAPVQDLDVETR
jgi:hypothetical protein